MRDGFRVYVMTLGFSGKVFGNWKGCFGLLVWDFINVEGGSVISYHP